MRAQALAAQAIRESNRFDGVFHRLQVEKIALAHIALWLYQQDDTVSDKAVRSTFDDAVRIVRSHFS